MTIKLCGVVRPISVGFAPCSANGVMRHTCAELEDHIGSLHTCACRMAFEGPKVSVHESSADG